MAGLKRLTNGWEKLVEKQEKEKWDFLELKLKPLVIRECIDKQLYFRSANGDWRCFSRKDSSVSNFSKSLEEVLNHIFDEHPYNNVGSLLEPYAKPD